MPGGGNRTKDMRAITAPFLPRIAHARFDGIETARIEQAMAGRAILCPERTNALAPPRGITLVPDRDISLRQRRCVHEPCPSADLLPSCGKVRRAGPPVDDAEGKKATPIALVI
jgi:hypothetical protein